MYMLRIVTVEYSAEVADRIARNVIDASRGRYWWHKILEPVSEDRVRPYFSEAEGQKYFTEKGIFKFLHENFSGSVLCLTALKVVDEEGNILDGSTEILTPFHTPRAHSLVSVFPPELSLNNPLEVHVQRASVVAAYREGRKLGLKPHKEEKRYTESGKLCVMTQAPKADDLASKIKAIEDRGIQYCNDCYRGLGILTTQP